jgi:hypothetical protein
VTTGCGSLRSRRAASASSSLAPTEADCPAGHQAQTSRDSQAYFARRTSSDGEKRSENIQPQVRVTRRKGNDGEEDKDADAYNWGAI